MQFLDDSLLPENQQPLVIQVAPFGPEFLPEDSDDIPVSLDAQIQKAVDCYNAGATVLHVHCREEDGQEALAARALPRSSRWRSGRAPRRRGSGGAGRRGRRAPVEALRWQAKRRWAGPESTALPRARQRPSGRW